MSVPNWQSMALGALVVADQGWHYDDPVLDEKLATSLRRHGQLRAIVTRTNEDGSYEVVDGRRLLRVMLKLGLERGAVAHLGAIDREAARRLALDLLFGYEVDYARLALDVAELLETGASAESLSAASPFTAERVRYFGQLARWDWSQYRDAPEGQTAMSWDDLPVPEPKPAQEPPLDVPGYVLAEADEALATPLSGAVQSQPEAPEPVQLPEPLVDAPATVEPASASPWAQPAEEREPPPGLLF